MKKFITLLFILSLTVLVGNSSYANVKPDIVPTKSVFSNDRISPLYYDSGIEADFMIYATFAGYEAVNFLSIDSVYTDASYAAVDMRSYDGPALIIFSCSKKQNGTNATLSVIIRSSTDNFVADSTTVKTFTSVTTTASNQSYLLEVGEQKRYWRVAVDIGGTVNPKFYADVKVIAKKKYL